MHVIIYGHEIIIINNKQTRSKINYVQPCSARSLFDLLQPRPFFLPPFLVITWILLEKRCTFRLELAEIDKEKAIYNINLYND